MHVICADGRILILYCNVLLCDYNGCFAMRCNLRLMQYKIIWTNEEENEIGMFKMIDE